MKNDINLILENIKISIIGVLCYFLGEEVENIDDLKNEKIEKIINSFVFLQIKN